MTSNDFSGPNAGYVQELYEKYQQDANSVDAETRAFFAQGYVPPTENAPVVPPPAVSTASPVAAAPTLNVTKIVAGARLGRIVRELGHLDARLDPLGGAPPSDLSLSLEAHGLTTDDMIGLPAAVIGGPLADGASDALEALARLRRAYSGSVGYEDDHIQIAEERDWLRKAVETGRFFQNFGPNEKRAVLERLTEVDTFEQFLHKTPPFQGQKRFSIEGLDMMVPVLDAIVRCTAQAGTHEVVIGMAHRGRLNVLAHILGKPYAAILAEFPTNPNAPESLPAVSGTSAMGYVGGDVKYHKGYRRAYTAEGAAEAMPITLAPNPSHLEFVDPAVVGRARAAQEKRNQPGVPVQDSRAALAIMIHGDAAFPGQGVVAETLNMSQIPGYRVGGTIHIIANNQIGFTTDPRDDRSTLYASDLAKGFEMPIVHVNADDPEACIAVAKMACAYREQFGKDFLIDLIGYRRLGHNETDEPAFTQPRMYEEIRAHTRVRELWASELNRQKIVSVDEAEAMVKTAQATLMEAKNTPRPDAAPRHPDAPAFDKNSGGPQTAVPGARLQKLNAELVSVPEGFTVDAKLVKGLISARATAIETAGGIIWAHAEALALASILEDGTPIRMTGQDTERGTFGQRNLVLHDPTSGEKYCPLQHLSDAKAAFALYNSPLSETAALGFEYGYSVHATDTLVLWEAQFGDFANGAQVIIDQFIASGNAKWGQSPSVVLLLPHGYEGQGPEHSSARLERFLQLCADDSMSVVNCSNAAQYFHVLRRQAQQLEADPRPLVVMTPKSLLRHPRAAASLSDLTQGTFQPVLDDPRSSAERNAGVTRLVLCSGKIYVDLVYKGATEGFAPRDEYESGNHLAIVRLEELNPFPAAGLEKILASYPNVEEIVWTQEEPRNMGAWSFVRPLLEEILPQATTLRYVGRTAAASPAEGSGPRHLAEQYRIVMETLAPSVAAVKAPLPAKNGASKNGKNGTGGSHNGVAVESTVESTSEPVKTKRTEDKNVG